MAFKMRSGNRPGFKMMGSSPMKQLPPLGSEERKAEYDRRGWKYDDTIAGYNRDGSEKVASKKATSKKQSKIRKEGEPGVFTVDKLSPRFYGLKDDRIYDIKDKELRGKIRKTRYTPGTSYIKKRGVYLEHDEAYYDKLRNKPRYYGLSNEEIQTSLYKDFEDKKRKSKYKPGSSDKK